MLIRFLFALLPFLLLGAGTAGCDSKDPADANPPPGVTKNPICPDPEAIQKRKMMLIDPRNESDPARIGGKH